MDRKKRAPWGAMMVVSGLACVATGARAEEGVFMKDVLGTIGLIEPEKPVINYRERAPLVVPPRLDLRTPVEPGSVATREPQWPNDPDVVARRKREADAKVPITEMERRRMSDTNPRVSVQELRAGRRAGAEIPDGPVVRPGDNSRAGFWVNPDELRAVSKEEEPLVSGVEPPRRALTEPPGGYRRSANGETVRRSFEPIIRTDEADPKAYIREQAARR